MKQQTMTEFWSWWLKSAPRIAAAIESGGAMDIVHEVSKRVRSIHSDLDWEFGPGQRSRHAFTISPEGNIELRRLTERLVRVAPPADSIWEYYPARQPNPDPDARLVFHDCELDGQSWRFAMDVDEDRLLINLDATHPSLGVLPDQARQAAGFVAMDQLFGEDAVETWLGELNFSVNEKPEAVGASTVMATMERLNTEAKKEVWTLASGADSRGRPLVLSFNQRLKRLHHLFADRLVEVELQLRRPTSNGLPASDELGELDNLDEQLVSAMGEAIYVGRLTGQGKRSMYIYTEDVGKLKERMERTLGASGVRYALRSKHDPQWDFYGREIFEVFAKGS